jgi:hypothetical protein
MNTREKIAPQASVLWVLDAVPCFLHETCAVRVWGAEGAKMRRCRDRQVGERRHGGT